MHLYNLLFLLNLQKGEIIKGSLELRGGTRNKSAYVLTTRMKVLWAFWIGTVQAKFTTRANGSAISRKEGTQSF